MSMVDIYHIDTLSYGSELGTRTILVALHEDYLNSF